MSDREGWTSGRFDAPRESLPPIHVDCSTWVDATDGTWTFGRFEAPSQTLPTVHIDCSGWVPEAGLELAFAATAAVGPVVAAVARAVTAAAAADPALGFAEDSARYRAGTPVRVVLTPHFPPADPARLEAVAAAVRTALADPTVGVRAVAA